MTPTPEQRQYAERWMAARGKEPEDTGYGFGWSDLEAEPEGLHPAIYNAAKCHFVRGSRSECIDDLALALAELKAAVEVPAVKCAHPRGSISYDVYAGDGSGNDGAYVCYKCGKEFNRIPEKGGE